MNPKAITIFACILLILPNLCFAQNSNVLHIPLYDSSLTFQTIQNAKNLMIAPDYNADIKIGILSNKVIRNDKVDFKVVVTDTGILKMKQPYYYILLVDGENNVIGTFPSPDGVNSFSGSKWTAWQIQSPCTFQGQTTDTVFQSINGTNWYISRDALLSSNGWMYYIFNNQCYSSTNDIIFTGKTNNILGTWQIYVFVYDSQPYCSRSSGGSTYCGDYSNKLVAWNYNEFQVFDATNVSSSSPSTTTQPNIIDVIFKFLYDQWVIALCATIIGTVIGAYLVKKYIQK